MNAMQVSLDRLNDKIDRYEKGLMVTEKRLQKAVKFHFNFINKKKKGRSPLQLQHTAAAL